MVPRFMVEIMFLFKKPWLSGSSRSFSGFKSRPMDSRAGSLLLRNVRRSLSWRSSIYFLLRKMESYYIYKYIWHCEGKYVYINISIHITDNWKPYFYGALENFLTRPGGTTKLLSKSCRNRALIFRSKSWWDPNIQTQEIHRSFIDIQISAPWID